MQLARYRVLWLAAAAVALGGGLGAWAWQSQSQTRRLPDSAPGFDRAHSAFTPKSVRSFSGFALYWAGGVFEGVPLKVIDADSGSTPNPGPGALDLGPVSFIYSDLGGCRTT